MGITTDILHHFISAIKLANNGNYNTSVVSGDERKWLSISGQAYFQKRFSIN